jgi:colanic acid/amylovoran biosynthesis glycosyltransferase
LNALRVLFLNGRFPQVSQTFVLNQIDYALEAGHDVDIFCAVLTPGVEHDIISKHDLYRRFVYGLPPDPQNLWRLGGSLVKRPRRVGSAIAAMIGGKVGPVEVLAALQVDREPDVIVANFGPNGIVGAKLKRQFFPDATLVTIFHGHDVTSYTKKHGWEHYRAVAPLIDLPLSVSSKWAMELRKNAGIAADVHYLGIPLDGMPERRSRTGGPFQVLFVGRMVEKKGVEYLLRAMRGLADRGLGVRARLLGDGPLLADLTGLAASLGLSDRVAFEGAKRHDEVLTAMAGADCLVAPSVTAANGDSEGIPVTIMEAMALGLPVISTVHAGIPELVENGISGLLAPERDTVALERHIRTLIESPDTRQQMASAARKTIEQRFNAATQNGRLFERLERLRAGAR